MGADCAKTATLVLDLRQPITNGSRPQNLMIPPHTRRNRNNFPKIRTAVRQPTTVRDKLTRT
jgi:hypothetical protein